MNNVDIFYIHKKNKFRMPVSGSTSMRFMVSPRKSNELKIINGDSVRVTWNASNGLVKNADYTSGATAYLDVTTSSAFTGDLAMFVPFQNKDIYSISINWGSILDAGKNAYNFEFGVFARQFTNLYSLHFNFYAAGNNTYRKRVSGDLAGIPKTLVRYLIQGTDVFNAPTLLYLNLSNFPANSKLEYFRRQNVDSGWDYNNLRVTGDLANIPPLINNFYLNYVRSNSTITYTPGRVWRSDFNTLYIDFVLPSTINNNILIDLSNSVTSAIGSKVIYLRGTRTSASDTAVANLQALGFTVTIAA